MGEFKRWCHLTGMDDARVVKSDLVCMETLKECWDFQQEKICKLEDKIDSLDVAINLLRVIDLKSETRLILDCEDY